MKQLLATIKARFSKSEKSKRSKKRRDNRRTIILILLIGGAIWVWEEVLEYHIIPKRWGTVEAGHIYRSGRLSTTLVEKMFRKYSIDVVVDLTSAIPSDEEQIAEESAVKELKIRHVRFPLGGSGTGDIRNYAGAIAAMVEARKRNQTVLVHCEAGAQRTGGVVACYQMLIEGKPIEYVYDHMQDYGWEPDDYKLVDYINANIDDLCVLLKQMGIIKDIPQPLPQLPDTYT